MPKYPEIRAITFALSVLSCGGRTQFASGEAAAGGYAGALQSSGGGANNSAQSGGSVSTGSGGSDFASRCSQLYRRMPGICTSTNIQVTAPFAADADSCDIPLSSSPADPTRLVVAIDCSEILLTQYVNDDAGGTNGWAIDYSQIPAHLRIFGDSCALLQVPGTHQLDIIMGYCGPP